MSDNEKDIQQEAEEKAAEVAADTAEAEANSAASVEASEAPKPKAKRKPKASTEENEEANVLKEEAERLKKENKELNDRYLRMLAEYDNFRKRSQADSERQRLVGITQTLTAVFPVIDSINRALEVLQEDDKAMAGIQQIKKQFDTAMRKLGVEQIPALGEEFNPEIHNAVMQEENAEMAGKVLQVFQEGYRYKDYVIRPAMVKVAV